MSGQRRSAIYWVEVVLAAALAIGILVSPVRLVLAVLAEVSFGALRTLVTTWSVDGPATLSTLVVALARVALCVAPTVALFLTLKQRRFWVLLWSLIFVPTAPFSLRSCPTVWHWLALVALSAAGIVMVRWWYLRWAVALPLLITLVIPWMDHGWDLFWPSERLAPRCAANDGERPDGLRQEQLAPAYYGLHPYSEGVWLLTGENERDGRFMGFIGGGTKDAGSWWVTRNADGRLQIGAHSRVSGNLWNGCLLDDQLWLLRANFVLSVHRDPDGQETVESRRVEMKGFDAAGIACNPADHSLFFMEGMDGHLWEMPLATFKPTPRPFSLSRNVGGFLLRREKDDRLLYMNTHEFAVVDPRENKVLQEVPTSLASINIDLCQGDGAVAAADLAGRVRLFSTDAQGQYHFDWGISLFAPRRVHFSPDCRYLAVTSGNDRDVWLLDRTTRTIAKHWTVGPSIRGIAFTAPRELDVVDACTVTSLKF